MREFKFRAWDKDSREMLASPDATPWNVLRYGIKYNFHVMQYTGYKDKFGKPIYEGDIVSYKSDRRAIFEVKYGSKFIGTIQAIGFNIDEPTVDYEVLGNVYENPRLLAKHECLNCGQPMQPQYDSIAKKVTGYLWKCDCMPENIVLSIG
jgi:hypothetical protein